MTEEPFLSMNSEEAISEWFDNAGKEAYEALKHDDFEVFIEARRKVLTEAIQGLLGRGLTYGAQEVNY
jgi:hypothetical protein